MIWAEALPFQLKGMAIGCSEGRLDLWDSTERDHRAIQLQSWLSFKKKAEWPQSQFRNHLGCPSHHRSGVWWLLGFRVGPLFGSSVPGGHSREQCGQLHTAMGMMMPLRQSWRAEHWTKEDDSWVSGSTRICLARFWTSLRPVTPFFQFFLFGIGMPTLYLSPTVFQKPIICLVLQVHSWRRILLQMNWTLILTQTWLRWISDETSDFTVDAVMKLRLLGL